MSDYDKEKAVIDAILADRTSLIQLDETVKKHPGEGWSVSRLCWELDNHYLEVRRGTKDGTKVGFSYITLAVNVDGTASNAKEYGPFECKYINGYIGAPGEKREEAPKWMDGDNKYYDDGSWDERVFASSAIQAGMDEGCGYLVRILARIPIEERKYLRLKFYNETIGFFCSGKVSTMIEKIDGVSVRMTVNEYADWLQTKEGTLDLV